MKSYTMTIDTGTTNTRVMLWKDGTECAGSAKSETGVRDTAITGSSDVLKQAVKSCMEEVLKEAKADWNQVDRILASGMITSNVGLAEIPHLQAPAGIEEMAEGARKILLEEICPLPITFIPGVKNALGQIDREDFEAMDMMRGEEVETIAILQHFPKDRPYLLVLPGSHTKFVSVNREGQISGCLTTISGEILSAITHHTLLADAVGHSFVTEEQYDEAMVSLGYQTAKKTGIGRACFSARILNTFCESDKSKIASFLLGAVLSSDLQAVKESQALEHTIDTTVIISGKNPFRRALVQLFLENCCFRSVEAYEAKGTESLSAQGALLIGDMLS